MACLKCGRETEQSFCEECRASMERYPVKPGTPVVLPNRSKLQKKVRRPEISPEVQIEKLKKTNLHLWQTVFCMAVVIAALCAAIYLMNVRRRIPQPGQNYSTVTHTTAETEQP